MTVFRVEKTKDFTVMSNHHLRNKTLIWIFETAPEIVSKIAGESKSQMLGRNRRKRDISKG